MFFGKSFPTETPLEEMMIFLSFDNVKFLHRMPPISGRNDDILSFDGSSLPPKEKMFFFEVLMFWHKFAPPPP